MRNKKAARGLKQKSYVIAAVIMLAAAFGMTGIYYSQQNKKQEERLAKEQEAADKRKAAEEKRQALAKKKAKEEREKALEAMQEEEETEEVSGIVPPKDNDFMDAPEVVAEKEEVLPKPAYHFDAANMKWPLQGNVIMNYSMDQTIYFATLDQYKYNPAIVIQAEVNTPVESVAAGKVTAVENSAETGATITVDMGDGYSAVYGQLKELSKNPGEEIAAGEVIGYVSEPTKYFTVEGSNLYFELQKDGVSVNPMEYLQ